MRALLLTAGLLATSALPSGAASFWLDHGYENVATCPGETELPIKAANVNSGLLITALLLCTDVGDSYRLDIDVLKVELNPLVFYSLDKYEFDWVGLAIYRPKDSSGREINWLYEDALPIAGKLEKGSTDVLAFSNLSFTYPKAAAEQATRFTLFVTFRGRVEQFGLL